MEPALKCINLDWLEVYCIEPTAMDANYFQNLGWQVNSRVYGTPLMREMFTLLGENGKPFLEIRRNPYSLKKMEVYLRMVAATSNLLTEPYIPTTRFNNCRTF